MIYGNRNEIAIPISKAKFIAPVVDQGGAPPKGSQGAIKSPPCLMKVKSAEEPF